METAINIQGGNGYIHGEPVTQYKESIATNSSHGGPVRVVYDFPFDKLEYGVPSRTLRSKSIEKASFDKFEPTENYLLNEAFSKISAAADQSLSTAERSNIFDDWKDLLDLMSRTIDHFTNNHRKILGSLISVIRDVDLFQLSPESLLVLVDSSNLLRQPRLTKMDSKRVISNLLDQGLHILVPLLSDNLNDEEKDALDHMMQAVLDKSS